jgi:KDO2-lipid IV(A) lauroyltransferase
VLRKRLERLLGRMGLKLAWGLFRFLPMGWAIRLGALVGLLGYMLSARYRRVAIRNLRHAFPEWSRARVHATARRTFRNFGVALAEFLKAPSMTRDQLEQRVELIGREHLDAAFREGKGVLLLTGHFGNWELMARYLVLLGYPNREDLTIPPIDRVY